MGKNFEKLFLKAESGSNFAKRWWKFKMNQAIGMPDQMTPIGHQDNKENLKNNKIFFPTRN